MQAANLPMVLRPEVLQYAVEVEKLGPTKALKGMTPTKKLTDMKPDISS
ncbi:hypothetical protein PC116_g17709 [Phytophthora cactorum]|nr:hypothetical protein PC114_g21669 [Phytophthora cactorum]KAG2902294.1 hypothetical protein PC117_g21500 [Phytophthora cactorum]KAG2970351.1 hypothetical protein PC119_g23662 [Phytophthora cactorum]KAG3134733.1 hypothetical protein C6341_g22032 [Phytophthora cactorum]KAG4234125.1 hypothetical protein PC116_g17709 [Phytophthora cactorum]